MKLVFVTLVVKSVAFKRDIVPSTKFQAPSDYLSLALNNTS
ncbi:hypothetical protein CLV48_10363 [Cecembia rubra]|uniref:Uncharacterized protein n=1 Tax=Cecembia rubra TaxID=1485585 RepID=A0A2P8E7T5_9BACT|nr:hypothetical protein CLV48_10363 [Cecembia rubra]